MQNLWQLEALDPALARLVVEGKVLLAHVALEHAQLELVRVQVRGVLLLFLLLRFSR